MHGARLVSTGTHRYLNKVHGLPMLEAEEESLLAKRYREQGDPNAAQQLVTSHLRLVAKTAMGYRNYGLPISELISEGNIGLMQALKRFDPEKGSRFSTYAIWWIKAMIQDYILHSWSLVKIGTTANQKKLFFNLRKMKSRLSALDEGDLHPDHASFIAESLGVTEQEVVDVNRRLRGDISLNAAVREHGDSSEWEDCVPDDSPDQETRLAESEECEKRRNALEEALTVLNERERRVFGARHLAEPVVTLEELGAEFAISRERVRQIEACAFQKVQRAARNAKARHQLRCSNADSEQQRGSITPSSRTDRGLWTRPRPW